MSHQISFKHAWDGVTYTFRSQPNMRFHSSAAIIALILAWYLGLSAAEWLILIFTIVLMFVAEMVNTAIESMTDLITTQYRQQAKIAKDVSAGMVLIAAMSTIIIGCFLFLPKIISLIA